MIVSDTDSVTLCWTKSLKTILLLLSLVSLSYSKVNVKVPNSHGTPNYRGKKAMSLSEVVQEPVAVYTTESLMCEARPTVQLSKQCPSSTL